MLEMDKGYLVAKERIKSNDMVDVNYKYVNHIYKYIHKDINTYEPMTYKKI